MKKLELTLNGQPKQFSAGDSLAVLVASAALDKGTVVIEHNGIIAPAEKLEIIPLRPGDVVEIIQFVGGG